MADGFSEGGSGWESSERQVSRGGASSAGRVLRARVPLWLFLLVLVVLGAGFLGYVFTNRPVGLGDGIDGARRVVVDMTLCNEVVDANDVNPRRAELDFERGLRELGAEEAIVRSRRIDCGPVTVP